MNRTLMARTWFMVTILGVIGLLAGLVGANVLMGRGQQFTAEATLAMLPAPEVPVTEVSSFWEVLNRGQATRSAAIVLADTSRLDAAAAAAQVPRSDLSLDAGAIPETTLITVTMKARSARAAEVALDSVLAAAKGPAADISGPFRLDVVASPDGSAVSMSPNHVQIYGALGIAGLLLAVGGGIFVSRTLKRRSARRSPPVDKRKHARIVRIGAVDDQVAVSDATAAPGKMRMR